MLKTDEGPKETRCTLVENGRVGNGRRVRLAMRNQANVARMQRLLSHMGVIPLRIVRIAPPRRAAERERGASAYGGSLLWHLQQPPAGGAQPAMRTRWSLRAVHDWCTINLVLQAEPSGPNCVYCRCTVSRLVVVPVTMATAGAGQVLPRRMPTHKAVPEPEGHVFESMEAFLLICYA